MYLAAIILSLEIALGIFITLPAQKGNHAVYYDQTNGRILGESDTNPDQQPVDDTSQPSPDQASSDQTTQSQPETSVQTSEPVQVPSDNSSAQQENSPRNTQNNLEQPNTNQSEQNTSQSQMNAAITALDSQVFPDVTNQNPSEQLSEQTVNEVKQQEKQLDSAQTPEEQANLLVNFESNNIQDINKNIVSNNFDDSAYSAERLSYQIDKSIDIIQQLPQAKAADLRNKIGAICKNAEYLLRPQQLVVPENVEQALEITRGKCFNFEK